MPLPPVSRVSPICSLPCRNAPLSKTSAEYEHFVVDSVILGCQGQAVHRVGCEKSAEARRIVHGGFGAGHLGRVASRDARCVAIPRAHRCWLGESPPRRSDRLSPRGESDPPRATWSPTASAHRRPAPSTRGARQATWPARIDAGGRYRHSGHDPPLVPEVDRPEVRRQSSKTARPPDDAPRHG